MSTSTGLQHPPVKEIQGGEWGQPGTPAGSDDGCMFCNDDLGLRSTGEDALAFIEHLDQSDECRKEYQLWKQVITDEWHGD